MSKQPVTRTIDDEYRLVLKQAGADVRPVLLFIGCTGARPAELISLRWSAIDWRQRLAELSAQKTAGRGPGRSRRVIALGPDALRLLHRLRRQRGARPASPYVFKDALGARWTRHTLYRRLGRVSRQLGFPAVLLLRDRFIARCLKPFPSRIIDRRAGKHRLTQVAKVLGHSSVNVARGYVRMTMGQHTARKEG